MSKYLVILAGLPRGGEATWKSIFKNVIKPLNADLAICTGNNIDKNSSLYKNSDYQWLFEEYDDWFDYYKENFSGDWKQIFKLGVDTGLYNSGSVHFAIKDIILKNYLQIIYEYDYFIYSRFDQFFIMKHPKYSGDFVWIPEGEDYTGLCDRHALIPTKHTKDYLAICDFVDTKISKYELPEYLNCEAVYKMHLEDIGLTRIIKRYPRFQFTTAKKNDFTRWRVPKYTLYLFRDIKLKYPNELLQSIKTLIDSKKFLQLMTTNVREYLNYSYLKLRISIGRVINNDN